MQSVWGGVGGSHKSKSGIWNSLCKSPEARRSTGYWREHGENGGAVRGKTRAGLEDHLKDPGTSSEINTKITDPYKGHVLERGPLLLFSLSDQTVPLLSSTQDSSLPLLLLVSLTLFSTSPTAQRPVQGLTQVALFVPSQSLYSFPHHFPLLPQHPETLRPPEPSTQCTTSRLGCLQPSGAKPTAQVCSENP